MRTTKLISIRVDEEDLKVIDEYCSSNSWRTRSDVINAGITLAALAIKKGLITDITSFNQNYSELDEFTFKYHEKSYPDFG